MANARGSRHTLSIGWDIRIAKVCQIHFTNTGTLLLTFPYHPDTPGIAARLKVLPDKVHYELPQEFSRVTSHKIKYSHPMDGRAHFSGDKKVYTQVWAEDAAPLKGKVGHIFTLHLKGVHRFSEVSPALEEIRDPTFHVFEFQASYIPSLRLVGRFMPIPDGIDVDQPGKTVVRARFADGLETDLMVLAPPAGNPLDDHAVFIQCIEEEPIEKDEEFHLSFQGGFGADLADHSSQSSMLILNYPAARIEEVASIDYTPAGARF